MKVLKEGYVFIFLPLAASAVFFAASHLTSIRPLFFIFTVLGSLLFVFSVFCVFFFRDPKIAITQGEGFILSPCNGTVMELAEDESEKIIRVFLSVFNVHLQRSPIDAEVTSIVHKAGKFYAAWNPRAHSENEQIITELKGKDGVYVVRQIAGFLARRCVTWVKEGDILKAGDKLGMIKFSSQVDLHLPKTAAVKVKIGDKVKAGISIIAEMQG